jgi:hypothetical protein
MKAIFCGGCFDIRALPDTAGTEVKCRCGNVTGWWTDPQRGIAKVHALERNLARVIGFNNRFLAAAFTGGSKGDEFWRLTHEQTTDAPGYLFDKSKRACPVVIILIGQTSDVTFDDIAVAPGGREGEER